MVQKVRTAVFPVAGLGTRFLPATKSSPKEMLTVVDRPVIQYVVDEARDAGIEHFVFVTGRGKGVIEDHFDLAYELEDTLKDRGKTAELEAVEKDRLPAGAASFTRQQEPLGLGHAVWCARELVGNEPFAVVLPDMIMRANPGALTQMIAAYDKTGGNVIAVEEVDPNDVSSYGIVARGDGADDAFEITGMVEKPKKEDAPTNLIISGRYILQPEIFELLGQHNRGAGGEIQLTDSMLALMEKQRFTGVKYQGRTFDTGSKLGFLTANVAYGLDRPELGDAFRAEIEALLKN